MPKMGGFGRRSLPSIHYWTLEKMEELYGKGRNLGLLVVDAAERSSGCS